MSAQPSVLYMAGAFADVQMADILRGVKPAQHTLTMYGRTHNRPRLEAWFGASPYTYSGETMAAREFAEDLLDIKNDVEALTGHAFDSCLVNYYRDGSDHVRWHADDEPGVGPVIASVSLGAGRRFVMRPTDGGPARPEWTLGHGDLLVMNAGTQEAWQHRIAKTAKAVGSRLSLTFRQCV